jgi:hypothetical protein
VLSCSSRESCFLKKDGFEVRKKEVPVNEFKHSIP